MQTSTIGPSRARADSCPHPSACLFRHDEGASLRTRNAFSSCQVVAIVVKFPIWKLEIASRIHDSRAQTHPSVSGRRLAPRKRHGINNLRNVPKHMGTVLRTVMCRDIQKLGYTLGCNGLNKLLPEQVVFAPLQERIIERVLPEWSGANNILHLVYPKPCGMLPSVRSLIDYLPIHVPAWLHENSI